MSREEALAKTVAGASVESALRVVLAGGVEVSARADGEGGGAPAVGAVLALPVVGADVTEFERALSSSDGGLAGGLAACCAGDD